MGDYRAYSDLLGDSAAARRLLMVPRMLLNPSFHALVIIRAHSVSPRWLRWFWRNLMIWKHSMDVSHRAEIAPGLVISHPFGFAIGPEVRIGRRVRIMHHVSIGGSLTNPGAPVIGDGAIIYSHSMIFGKIEIGAGSIVGAGSFIDFDVPPGSVVRAHRGELLEGRATELYEETALQRL